MRICLGLVLFVIGCGPTVVVTEGDTGGEDTPPGPMTNPPTPSTSSATSPPPPTTLPPPPDDSSSTGYLASSTGSDDAVSISSFILGGDEGWTPYECDTFAQDCPEGEKCMPWANDGGTDWNATRCAPVAADPDLVGEACVVEGSAYSGVDSCDYGAMCFFVDAETNAGTCVALCAGDFDDPTCDGITTCLTNEAEALTVCLEECDPTAAGCSTGNQCVPGLSRFVCTPYAPGAGVYGTECEPFGCDAGLSCQDPADVSPSCDPVPEGCCTTYCDTDGAPCPEAGQSCEAYYGAGEAAEGYEHIGLCLTV